MYTNNDLELLEEKGISRSQIETQLDYFKNGFPYLKIVSAARIGNGILKIDEAAENIYLQKWNNYLNSNKTITKFVPASGAASRIHSGSIFAKVRKYTCEVSTISNAITQDAPPLCNVDAGKIRAFC